MVSAGRDDAENILVIQGLKLGRAWLRDRLAEKLTAAGVDPKPDLLGALTDRIAGSGGEGGVFALESEDDGLPPHVTLEFTDNDVADLDAILERYKALIPRILAEFVAKESEKLFKALRKGWIAEHALQDKERSDFVERLEERYGEGLALLRMLLTMAREIGGERRAYDRHLKKDRHLRDVLSRLHARACQITAEIIVLIEHGFADGAMARWRTLHEISVIATVLAKGGDGLAERYTAHHKIESKKALEDYERCCEGIGYRPMPKASAKRIQRNYDAAVALYGSEFARAYGWATPFLRTTGLLKPREHAAFATLQQAANRTSMQSHFRMASHNVHAGPHGIYFRLGKIGYSEVLLAGASNAGLVEPGQNAAITLMQVTALLFPANPTTYDLVALRAFERAGRAVPDAFARADRKLQRDHKAIEMAKDD
jgi:hypothetical protein